MTKGRGGRRGAGLPETMAKSRHRSVEQAARFFNEVKRQLGRAGKLNELTGGGRRCQQTTTR